MLIGTHNTPFSGVKSDTKTADDMELIAMLINSGQYIEGWILLQAAPSNSVPYLFNKAICLITIKDYAQAASLLETALRLYAHPSSGLKVIPSPELDKIKMLQNETATYTKAITPCYIELFPEIFKDTIARLLVDCYLELGNHNKVLEIGMPLKNKGYNNISDAIKENK